MSDFNPKMIYINVNNIIKRAKNNVKGPSSLNTEHKI